MASLRLARLRLQAGDPEEAWGLCARAWEGVGGRLYDLLRRTAEMSREDGAVEAAVRGGGFSPLFLQIAFG
jgi:hypothetical protein